MKVQLLTLALLLASAQQQLTAVDATATKAAIAAENAAAAQQVDSSSNGRADSIGKKFLKEHKTGFSNRQSGRSSLSALHQYSVSPAPHTRVKMESAKIKHRVDLEQGQRAPADLQHKVVFAIRDLNTELLKQAVLDVSNPYSERYARYVSRQDVRDLTRNDEAKKYLSHFLRYHGIDTVSSSTEYVEATTSLAKWEEIFSTEFFEFSVSGTENELKIVRALDYSLPKQLAAHVKAVFNVVQFPDPDALSKATHTAYSPPLTSSSFTTTFTEEKKSKKSPKKLHSRSSSKSSSHHHQHHRRLYSNGGGTVTPALLNQVYSIDSNVGNVLSSQAMYETYNQSFSPSDLTIFQANNGLPQDAVANDIGGHMYDNACLATGKGGRGPLSDGVGEPGDLCLIGNLNMQYLTSISQNTPTTYYYWEGEDFMLDWITQVAAMSNPPLVIGIAYTTPELYVAQSYAEAFDSEAMKLALMGVTLVAASGDDGVAGAPARTNPSMCGYYPMFPASSPYVTSVGATMGPENGEREVTCQSDMGGYATSGGGFSTLYGVPEWQVVDVEAYKNKFCTMPPTIAPSGAPSNSAPPSRFPTAGPTSKPPTAAPSREPSSGFPSMDPTVSPTQPSAVPTEEPTLAPTDQPSAEPTSGAPSESPSATPSALPSPAPSFPPTDAPVLDDFYLDDTYTPPPSIAPTAAPSEEPTVFPTMVPTTHAPSLVPTFRPSAVPSTTSPTANPTLEPTDAPSAKPSSAFPTYVVTLPPSAKPTFKTLPPTLKPSTNAPIVGPTRVPSKTPTVKPTFAPSEEGQASFAPTTTHTPSFAPTTTVAPSMPTASPSYMPSAAPSACLAIDLSYDQRGRGYPDLALLGHNYEIVANEKTELVSSTAASTPVLTGMIALVNSERLAAGRGPLGWLNPSLYATANQYTNDITSGSNNCAAGAYVCCEQGFMATNGWDPVTGLGSINFTKFKEVFINLGNGDSSLSVPTVAPSTRPGFPSQAPVVDPNANQPTKTPSAQPTHQAGWVSYYFYDAPGCVSSTQPQNVSSYDDEYSGGAGATNDDGFDTGNPFGGAIVQTSFPTDDCFIEYDAAREFAGSRRYSCDNEKVHVAYYSDLYCQTPVSSESRFIGCADVSPSGDGEYVSMELTCSYTSGSPLPKTGQAYVVQSNYEAEDCGAAVSQLTATLTDYCIRETSALGKLATFGVVDPSVHDDDNSYYYYYYYDADDAQAPVDDDYAMYYTADDWYSLFIGSYMYVAQGEELLNPQLLLYTDDSCRDLFVAYAPFPTCQNERDSGDDSSDDDDAYYYDDLAFYYQSGYYEGQGGNYADQLEYARLVVHLSTEWSVVTSQTYAPTATPTVIPSLSPSVAPSKLVIPAPTRRPTVEGSTYAPTVNNLVEVDMFQVLNGLTASVYYSSQDNINTLLYTLASVLNVDPSMISGLNISDFNQTLWNQVLAANQAVAPTRAPTAVPTLSPSGAPTFTPTSSNSSVASTAEPTAEPTAVPTVSTRRKLTTSSSSLRGSEALRRQLQTEGSSVEVQFVVRSNEANVTYDSLVTLLNNSVNDGSYDSTLSSYATGFEATAMQTTSAAKGYVSYRVLPTVIVTDDAIGDDDLFSGDDAVVGDDAYAAGDDAADDDDDTSGGGKKKNNDDDELSAGVYAGIAVAAFVVLVCCVVAVYFIFKLAAAGGDEGSGGKDSSSNRRRGGGRGDKYGDKKDRTKSPGKKTRGDDDEEEDLGSPRKSKSGRKAKDSSEGSLRPASPTKSKSGRRKAGGDAEDEVEMGKMGSSSGSGFAGSNPMSSKSGKSPGAKSPSSKSPKRDKAEGGGSEKKKKKKPTMDDL